MAVLRLFTAFFVFVTVVTGCINEEEDPPYALQTGDELPAFTVTMNDGSRISSGDLAGTVSVIALFNTSCVDCRNELPVVQAVYGRCVADECGVRFLCIARDEGAESIEAYWAGNGLTLPYSPQYGREVYSLFASEGIPRIYVVSPELTVWAAFSDVDMPSEEKLLAAVGAAVAAAGQ